SCSIPGQAHEERLGAEEGELGLGIHGEPGAERIALSEAVGILSLMTERLSVAMAPDARYALLINNLGAVPPIEMALLANAVLSMPIARQVAISIGPAPMMTALNMNGFSLSLLKLDAHREEALLVPVGPHAWVPAVVSHTMSIVPAPREENGD